MVNKPVKMRCPMCGRGGIKTQTVDHKFKYGVGPGAIELRARIPVRECPACGFRYTDSEAEDVLEGVIRAHLEVRHEHSSAKDREARRHGEVAGED